MAALIWVVTIACRKVHRSKHSKWRDFFSAAGGRRRAINELLLTCFYELAERWPNLRVRLFQCPMVYLLERTIDFPLSLEQCLLVLGAFAFETGHYNHSYIAQKQLGLLSNIFRCKPNFSLRWVITLHLRPFHNQCDLTSIFIFRSVNNFLCINDGHRSHCRAKDRVANADIELVSPVLSTTIFRLQYC